MDKDPYSKHVYLYLHIEIVPYIGVPVIVLLRENSGGKPLTMNSSGLGVVLCKVLLVSSG